MSVRERLRSPVSPRRFLQLAVGTVAVLGLVVTSGAFVRLTGSGLGCDNWPRCGSTPFPAMDFHPMVEFGNRVIAVCGILASLADPRATSDDKARELIGIGKPIYWITSGMHSPETGGPEML